MEDHHDSAVEDKNDYTTGTEISDNQVVGKVFEIFCIIFNNKMSYFSVSHWHIFSCLLKQVANDHDDTIAKSGHEADGRSDGSSFSHVEKQVTCLHNS